MLNGRLRVERGVWDDDDDGREEEYPIDDTLSLICRLKLCGCLFGSPPHVCLSLQHGKDFTIMTNGRLRVERDVWDDVETETNVDDYDADGERRRTVLIDDTLSLWCSYSHHHLPSCFMDACGSRGASGDEDEDKVLDYYRSCVEKVLGSAF